MSDYTPPAGNAVVLRLGGAAYTAPAGNAVVLRFATTGGILEAPAIVAPEGITPRFRCTLTGAPDSLPNVIVIARSWQGTRHNATRQSYVGAVCSAAQLDAIEARPNGELVIEWGWTGAWIELLRAPLQTVRRDRGARADTLTLSGTATLAVPTLYQATLAGVSRRARQNGSYRRWLAFDPRIRPGYSIVDGTTTFTADYLTYNASANAAILEVGQYQ